jgi:signal transduction histidine kinase
VGAVGPTLYSSKAETGYDEGRNGAGNIASMMHPPRTVNAALLLGFLVIFAVWLASTSYFTRRLDDAQERSAAMQGRHARGQELLFEIRSQVLLGSIYVRDALIETTESSAAAAARDQLRLLHTQMKRELEQYRTIDSIDDANWKQLEQELRDYWEAAALLVSPAESDGTATAYARLHTQVIPKRDSIVELSDHIRRVMADAFSREQAALDAANQQVRRRVWETTAVAVIVGVAIAMLSTWYVNRLEAAVRKENAEVARSRQELRHLSGRLVRAQEDERRTIARELHDEIGQALTAVDVELAIAQGAVTADGRAGAAIHEARAVTQHALGSARDLSQLLRPSMLDDFGLPDTLKWYLRRFSDRTGVRTELVEDRLSERLPIDVEVCVYRTIQEALTNVSRHAQATACRVFVQRLASSLIVTVEDDGVGLQRPDVRDTPGRGGLGLIGIRERLSDLGGTFRIEGAQGKGTRLTIELPLPTKA